MQTRGYSPLWHWFKWYNFPIHCGATDISWLFHHPDLLKSVKEISQEASFFADNPWCFLYRIFDEWYPNSKFILTVRSSTFEVVNSAVKMFVRNRFKDKLVNSIRELSDNTKAYHELFQDYLMLTAKNYELHNKNVLAYFNQNEDYQKKLLVINFSEEENPWLKICHFLDCPVPNTNFPIENTAPKNQIKSILPTNYDLNWSNYQFPDKYYKLADIVEKLNNANVVTDKDWKKLEELYQPLINL